VTVKEFDAKLPGTITFHRPVGDAGVIPPPAGYREVALRTNPKARDPLEDGRFTFIVPTKLGPARTNADEFVEVSISVPYIDRDGDTHWGTQLMKVPVLGVKPGDEVRVSTPRGELVVAAVGDGGVPSGVALLQFNAVPAHETGASALIDCSVRVVGLDVEKVI